jgi:hypothetical protein
VTPLIAAVICAAGFSQIDAEARLHATLLGDSYHAVPASQMVVKDMAVAMPSVQGSSSEWLKEFEKVPSELRRAASRHSPTKPHRLDPSLFPPGTRLVPASAVERIFTGGGVEENWSAFNSQFKSRGWLAFSDALLTGDRLDALVYYEARCGGLCGEGGYAWLRRDSVRSPWRIEKKIVSWMS